MLTKGNAVPAFRPVLHRPRIFSPDTGRKRPAPVVIMANRLPGTFLDDGSWVRSPGGLVSALFPAVEGRSATWIGATTCELRGLEVVREGVHLVAVRVDPNEYQGYCDDFANGALWPLFHDAIRAPRYDESAWRSYVEVNQRFAEVAAAEAPGDAMVWVHDYHLALVPTMLRRLRDDVRIGYFHHVPFPQSDLFRQLPWRDQLLEGLLGADLLGFQRRGDLQNFVSACAATIGADVCCDGQWGTVRCDGRSTRAGVFPVPVDAASFAEIASEAATVRRASAIRETCGIEGRLLLGVDRLDYTKGIDQRLRVIRSLFEKGVLDPHRDAYLQLAVPTRHDVVGYGQLRAEVERLVGDINGTFAALGRPVVHYLHRSVGLEELVALYRAADVMLVTPYRDGMNLVAKEFVASRVDDTGQLVLSEFTGAADQLVEARMVNPHDSSSLADAIGAAVDHDERDRTAMATMRRRIARQKPADWSSAFLAQLAECVR